MSSVLLSALIRFAHRESKEWTLPCRSVTKTSTRANSAWWKQVLAELLFMLWKTSFKKFEMLLSVGVLKMVTIFNCWTALTLGSQQILCGYFALKTSSLQRRL